MPVTPFHFGVGLALKGLKPEQVSLIAFAASQVVIDLESGYYLFIAREWPVHRWAHSFVGAALLGLLTAVVCARVLPAVSRVLPWVPTSEMRGQSCIVGGLLGGLSHTVLDGVMHTDVVPFFPVAAGNPLLGALSLGALHLLCVGSGLLGLVLLATRWSVNTTDS
jgi:membrane-bound metal-dependent hydrolase YbcI (DUF457 family)